MTVIENQETPEMDHIAKTNLGFRSDINGLRALAVLPVLFFHAGLPMFSGGFLGVDVFFVISGYLITEKLLRSIRGGTFSFMAFYDNRIRRIIPALLVVVACTTALSTLFMVPYSLKNYGQSLVATMLSANNILLFLTSGYWSFAAEFKPLYHTWSLGVEEQYYLLAPLLLCVLYSNFDHGGRAIRALLGALLIGSVLLALLLSDKEFKFLFIFTRAWELLAGAVLALAASESRTNPFLSALGLLLLLTSYVIPNALGDNQAIVVATPVIATCMIIRFSGGHDITGKLLSLKPFQFIGLISYSVYLWHQPILAFVRLGSAQAPHQLTLLAYSLLSLPLGYLSWRYVENVFRNRNIVPARKFYSLVAVGVGLSLMIGYTLNKTYGFKDLAPQFAYGENPQVYVEKPMEMRSTSFHSSGKYRVLVVGNSFARDYINMMQETGHLSSMDVVYTDDDDCSHKKSVYIDTLLATSNLVVFSQDWGKIPRDREVLEVYSCYQDMRQKSSGRVVVLGPKNFGWNNDFVRFFHGNLSSIRVTPLDSVAKFNEAERALIGDDYVDVLGTISDPAGRVPVFTPEGRFITYDSNHLTKAGARYVGSELLRRYGFLIRG